MERKAESYKAGELALTEKEMELLLSGVDRVLDKGLLMLALAGGLRRDDVMLVRQSDLDPKERTLTFWEEKKNRHKTISLSPNVITALQMIINAYPKSEWLFPKSNNPKKHISSKTVYNILQKYLLRAGLKPRPFHTLRATCGKLCISKGWSYEQIASHLGDRVDTIQAHYTTPSKGEMSQVASEKAIL